ncbi:MAG TPA: HU family DNA-binding protein [Verrucomicrobiae bacterium]|jgi:nucleoid DNA-binding protein|nr:HU family DNA-binding protein [Verrucomicrobiae bacterium]
MTKRDLVVRISEETGLVQQDVLDVVQKTLDYISDAVTKGQKVELRNFGVFEVKVRKARVGRNPNAPAADVPIPPRAVVKFKPGKEMREAVLKLTPQQIEQQQKLEEQAQKAGPNGEPGGPATQPAPTGQAAPSSAAPHPH